MEASTATLTTQNSNLSVASFTPPHTQTLVYNVPDPVRHNMEASLPSSRFDFSTVISLYPTKLVASSINLASSETSDALNKFAKLTGISDSATYIPHVHPNTNKENKLIYNLDRPDSSNPHINHNAHETIMFSAYPLPDGYEEVSFHIGSVNANAVLSLSEIKDKIDEGYTAQANSVHINCLGQISFGNYDLFSPGKIPPSHNDFQEKLEATAQSHPEELFALLEFAKTNGIRFVRVSELSPDGDEDRFTGELPVLDFRFSPTIVVKEFEDGKGDMRYDPKSLLEEGGLPVLRSFGDKQGRGWKRHGLNVCF